MLHSRSVPWATRSRSGYQLSATRHWLHTNSAHPRRPSRHAQFYSELVPAMIPVALLGSAVYMGLHLLQTNLSHEKHLDEARARVRELEQEIDALVLERRSTSPPHLIANENPSHPKSWLGWLRRG